MKAKVITAILLLATSAAAQKHQTVAPEVMTTELPAIDGSGTVRLADEKKIIVLAMWAEWCAPCLSQIAKLERLNRKYHERGLDVVGLLNGANAGLEDRIKRRASESGLTFKNVWVSNDTLNGLQVLDSHGLQDVLPVTLIITNRGEVLASFEGWKNKVTSGLVQRAITKALNIRRTRRHRRLERKTS